MAIKWYYKFNWWLTTDSSWNWYTLTQRNSPTNPIWRKYWSFAATFTWTDDPWWTSEWATSNYMYYSWGNMWIVNTWNITMEWLIRIDTNPASWIKFCFFSKQVPWLAHIVLYENVSWTYKLRFFRNRDYVASDYFDYSVTLTIWKWYHILYKYNWSTIYWYLDSKQKESASSSWVWTTKTYTWIRV